MKTCDVCGASLKFMNKFKYESGYICKSCYEKASNHCTETITHKSFAEIKKACMLTDTKDLDTDFEITGRIGNYLLFDEKNHKICITNNRSLHQEAMNPEFYSLDDILKCSISTVPSMSINELKEQINQQTDTIIKKLCVIIQLKDKTKKEICLLQSPVRIKSYAFKKSLSFAIRISDKINDLLQSTNI